MRAVVIGAGRVGLGCAARLVAESGLDLAVLARGRSHEELARHGTARIVSTDGNSTHSTDVPLEAIDLAQDPARARRAIARADVVFTAVGAASVPVIADLLAESLAGAERPVDVIALENREDAGDHLRRAVGARLSGGVQHGFSGAVVDGVVAQRRAATATEPVTVIGEPHCQVVVDERALMTDWSVLARVSGTRSFRSAYRRKLFRYSTGHAATAYLGMLKGYRYLHAAIADPEIAEIVLAAMEEGRQGLLHKYGPEVAGTPAELRDIVARFGNATLGDTTARVGADVPRKVARGERIVGAARLARKAGCPARSLALVTAAALQAELARVDRSTVAALTGERASSGFVTDVCAAGEGLRGPALLSIRESLPAWEGTVARWAS